MFKEIWTSLATPNYKGRASGEPDFGRRGRRRPKRGNKTMHVVCNAFSNTLLAYRVSCLRSLEDEVVEIIPSVQNQRA
jgi:hypothetical protein